MIYSAKAFLVLYQYTVLNILKALFSETVTHNITNVHTYFVQTTRQRIN